MRARQPILITRPSTVLLGDTRGASGRRPSILPPR
jgi:hypothetical protein